MRSGLQQLYRVRPISCPIDGLNGYVEVSVDVQVDAVHRSQFL